MEEVLEERRKAAQEAVQLVDDGMLVGLGSGSTVELFLKEFLKEKKVKIIAASRATQLLADSMGFASYYLDSPIIPDITFDSADRVDPFLNLLKGGGGALLGEKLLARRSKKYVIIIDERKFVKKLFLDFPLPVEIEPISYYDVNASLRSLNFSGKLRTGTGKNGPILTDNGNWIIDLDLSAYQGDFTLLDRSLKLITGIVETGIFVDLVSDLIIGSAEGVNIIRASK